MTDLDFDGLVEMGARAAYEDDAGDPRGVPWEELWDPVKAPYREDARAILSAVLPHVLAGPREALGPLASVADDYDDSEDDALRVLVDADFFVSRLLLGTFRRARAELARIDKLTEGM